MKHHFGDFLDRDEDYWTVIPNVERYSYRVEHIQPGDKQIRVATIGQSDMNWRVVFDLPNLEELTLHEPSKDQLAVVSGLKNIKRLRITHARPKDIEFMAEMVSLEELVLEYVSGFSDLSPLRELKKLKSIHFENLRRVSDLSGLAGIESLRYACIYGTFDWKQPISNFEFLNGLPNLEVLALWQVINKTEFPALLPALSLKRLKKVKISNNVLAAKEYALLSVILEDVEGADWGPYVRRHFSWIPLPKDDVRYHLPKELIKERHPEVHLIYTGEREIGDPEDEWCEFTGKGAGRTKCGSLGWEEKCAKYAEWFEAERAEARALIVTRRQSCF